MKGAKLNFHYYNKLTKKTDIACPYYYRMIEDGRIIVCYDRYDRAFQFIKGDDVVKVEVRVT